MEDRAEAALAVALVAADLAEVMEEASVEDHAEADLGEAHIIADRVLGMVIITVHVSLALDLAPVITDMGVEDVSAVFWAP